LSSAVHFLRFLPSFIWSPLLYLSSRVPLTKFYKKSEFQKSVTKDGIEQLKSYMMSKGAPVAVWSNGSEKVLLYRPYPSEFEDTLVDIPRKGESPKEVIEKRRTLADLDRHFNFKGIVHDIEELALANYGDGVFDEIFKLIFAKIYDELKAEERPTKEVYFRKSDNHEVTYGWINGLFQNANEEWPGIFKEGDKIELKPSQLSICIGPLVKIRLMGSNLRIMDDAFEYLVPSVLKKKDGQFFTPRHVIDMCVRMLNPKKNEFIMDSSCGSAGFLLHAMDWCFPASSSEQMETRKHKYASKYLWGIDFSEKASKTSRALMLIAGDGHSNIFGPRASSLDPSDWLDTQTGRDLIEGLRRAKLLAKMPGADKIINDEGSGWDYYDNLKFDLILTNPPFAGEIPGKKLLSHFELAKKALKTAGEKKTPVEERDVLFIERIIKWLKPGGRAAVVLPQSKFNNSSHAFIREWILRKARLLAVVGLHGNTFKPHTGTKTSVLFVQKYTEDELCNIDTVKQTVAVKCPNYENMIQGLISKTDDQTDVSEEEIPEAILELMMENFSSKEPELEEQDESSENSNEATAKGYIQDESSNIDVLNEKLASLKSRLVKAKQELSDFGLDKEALEIKKDQELKFASKDEKAKITVKYTEQKKKLEEKQKGSKKRLKAEIKALEEKLIPETEYEMKLLSNKGKLQIVLEDNELIAALKDRWIDAEVAKKLDYPIFMAVSERGGKNNSGDYEHTTDENGNLMEFPEGHPQEGQPIINQDLVNYNLTPKDLVDASKIPDDQLCIAEAFVRFAQKNKFDFWGAE
ncbi:MAG: N-6 DNA methylase, partial [Deltaproteobacteria bacterium]|nr:N-6 DNA methylase [Deltaproteobacteria bacterium]